MKKLVSMALALTLAASASAMVFAENDAPTVYVDKSEIIFEDQEPIILGEGYTVIPARGVFEAMGAKVDWIAEERQVDVMSGDNKTLIRLFIDNDVMSVYDLSNKMSTLLAHEDFNASKTDITLDVAPQIINGRTMIPFRAISEALDAKVVWDGETRSIDVTTSKAPTSTDGLPAYSMSADKLTAAEGETVDLYIDAKNITEGMFVSGVSVGVKYNPANFEFVSSALMNGENVVEGAYGAENAKFRDDMVKTVYVTIDSEAAAKADGHVMKLTFKSLNGQEGAFSLSNGYHTKLGYHTMLTLDYVGENMSKNAIIYQGNNLVTDMTPVVINAAE